MFTLTRSPVTDFSVRTEPPTARSFSLSALPENWASVASRAVSSAMSGILTT